MGDHDHKRLPKPWRGNLFGMCWMRSMMHAGCQVLAPSVVFVNQLRNQPSARIRRGPCRSASTASPCTPAASRAGASNGRYAPTWRTTSRPSIHTRARWLTDSKRTA